MKQQAGWHLKHGHMTRFENGQPWIPRCPHCGSGHWLPDLPVGTCPETGRQFKIIDRR
jgi:hypothetical protein